MELLPVELRKTLPPLYSQRVVPDPDRARQVVHTRLVIYLVHYRGRRTGRRRLAPLFRLVIGLEEEWGYSLLSEIASARGPLGLPVERDLWFKPGPIDQVLSRGRPSAAVKEGDM